MKALKSGHRALRTAGMTPQGGATASDRYEKRSSRRQVVQEELDEIENVEGGADIMDEQRSIHAELDYTKKDASRHIVSEHKVNSLGRLNLRERLLRNLEGVRKNKPILRSDLPSNRSHRSNISRVSKVSKSVVKDGGAALTQPDETAEDANNGRLTRIDEDAPTCCEVTGKELDDEDLGMCEDISKQM